MTSKGIEPQSMNGFYPIIVESVLHVIAKHKTQELKCNKTIQCRKMQTNARLHLDAFKGDGTPIHNWILPNNN
jgi:hypothetical protein